VAATYLYQYGNNLIFSFINVNAEPEFVPCIKQAISLLNLSDRSQFTKNEIYHISI